MQKPLKEIKSEDQTVWITQPNEIESLLKKRETAFEVAKGKFAESNGNLELVMQTAEAFGRGLSTEHIREKPETVRRWLESATEQIFNPMGTGATFTKITDDEAESKMFRCLLHDDSDDPEIVSVFNYGFMRGMFLTAFPNGELLMKNSMAKGAPMTELTFKANANVVDKLERQRVMNSFEVSEKFKEND